ncbi:MAG TPA: hypothetical protein VF610_04605, partial [Segetibacter sp.]
RTFLEADFLAGVLLPVDVSRDVMDLNWLQLEKSTTNRSPYIDLVTFIYWCSKERELYCNSKAFFSVFNVQLTPSVDKKRNEYNDPLAIFVRSNRVVLVSGAERKFRPLTIDNL